MQPIQNCQIWTARSFSNSPSPNSHQILLRNLALLRTLLWKTSWSHSPPALPLFNLSSPQTISRIFQIFLSPPITLVVVIYEYTLLARPLKCSDFWNFQIFKSVLLIGSLLVTNVNDLMWHRKLNRGVLLGFYLITVVTWVPPFRGRARKENGDWCINRSPF